MQATDAIRRALSGTMLFLVAMGAAFVAPTVALPMGAAHAAAVLALVERGDLPDAKAIYVR